MIYNKKTGQTIVKSFTADNIPSTVYGFDLSQKGNNRLLIQFLRGDTYHQINYDPHKNLYYVLYSLAKIDDEPRQRYLVVFDSEIEKLDEIKLPLELSPKFVISKKGLLFRNVNDDSFNTLTLHVLNVVVEQQ